MATRETPTKDTRTAAPGAARLNAPGQGGAQNAPGGLLSAWRRYLTGLLGKDEHGKADADPNAPDPSTQSTKSALTDSPEKKKGEAEELPAPPGGMLAWTPADQEALDKGLAAFGVIGAHQAGRVKPAAEKLSANDLKLWRGTVDAIGDPINKTFVFKALAASHSVVECVSFATDIAGKDEVWLLENCTGGDALQLGTGTRQAYSHTCGVTTVQTVRAEYDPVYALKLHTENPDLGQVDNDDPTKLNPKAAAEQKAMHETEYDGDHGKHTGVTASRTNIAAGGGRWVDDWLNSLTAATGLTYKTKKDPSAAEAVNTLTDKVGGGMMTPVVIGNGKGEYTHYNLVMHTRVAAEPEVAPGAGPEVAPKKARPTLRFGSQGDAVRELQTRLNEEGEALAVDGIFGPLTRGAVVGYQTKNGLDPDGIVGPKTWGKLDEPKPDQPKKAKEVRQFQFHDPWDGETIWVSENKIVKGVIDIAGSNMVTALEVPTAA